MASLSSSTTRQIQLGTLALLLTEVLICTLQVGGQSDKSIGLAVFWPLAWLGLGGLLGFLFGIPKVLQQDGLDSSAGASRYAIRVNTNLEQISDWLTKLLIGVGLVELSSLPESIAKVALEMTGNTPGLTKSMAEAIIVLFSVQGFLGGYLCTRLYLAHEFSRADQALREGELLEALTEEPDPSPEGRTGISEAQKEAADLLVERPLRDVSGKDVVLWARAQAIRNNTGEATTGYRSAIAAAPKSLSLRLEFAQFLNVTGKREEAWAPVKEAHELLKKRKAHSQIANYVYEWLTYLPLWEGADGAKKVVQYVDEFRERYPDVSVPVGVLVNLTAAYGQQARALREEGVATSAPEFTQLRARTLEALRAAVMAGGQERLKQLLDSNAPGRQPDDNDLEVFESDEDFRTALGLPPFSGKKAA